MRQVSWHGQGKCGLEGFCELEGLRSLAKSDVGLLANLVDLATRNIDGRHLEDLSLS